MLRIYSFNKNEKTITFSVSSYEDFSLADSVLSEIFSNIYVDWIYILEELNDVDSILNKKLTLTVKENKKSKIVVLSVQSSKTLALLTF